MKIGQKLKGMRIEKGLSTIEIAEKIGVSESTYRRCEKSFPDVFTLDKIAKTYGKNLADLLPEGITIINNNSGEHFDNVGYIFNQQSEKLIEQYEMRLKEKMNKLCYLKTF
jgi:transcriptional regulator with XRE-family HTH domain